MFLTGWALSSDCWGYQMPPLSERGFRAIAYGRRGRVARVLFLAPTLPFLLKTADNERAFFMPDTPVPILDWGRGPMVRCSMKAVIECNPAMVETDFRPEMQKLDLPSPIIQSDGSALLPLTGGRTARLVPAPYRQVQQRPDGVRERMSVIPASALDRG